MPPLFTSFDEAWRWFVDGGELTPMGRWRERFTGGRAQLLSFQVPLADATVADAIGDLQDELAASTAAEHLIFFEREMLHISIRAAGFQVIAKKHPGDILPKEAARIANDARTALRGVRPIDATIGSVNVFPDALVLEVRDGGALSAVRDALAPVVDDAFGLSAAQYLPHTTIAMFRSPEAAAPLRAILPALRDAAPEPLQIAGIELARWWFTGIDDDDLPERETARAYSFRR